MTTGTEPTHTTDDLVKRLREAHPHSPQYANGSNILAEAAKEIETLRWALQASPCSCMTFGTISFPPSASDCSTRTWCARCRALGYDKNPEPKPSFVFPNQLVLR